MLPVPFQHLLPASLLHHHSTFPVHKAVLPGTAESTYAMQTVRGADGCRGHEHNSFLALLATRLSYGELSPLLAILRGAETLHAAGYTALRTTSASTNFIML